MEKEGVKVWVWSGWLRELRLAMVHTMVIVVLMGTEVRVLGLAWRRKESRSGPVRVVARVECTGGSAGIFVVGWLN